MKPGLAAFLALACVLSSTMLGLGLGASTTEEPPAVAAPPPAQRSELEGSVYLGRNRKVAGASVTITLAEDASKLYLTSSDAKGAFKLKDLRDGTYRIEVAREGLSRVVTSGVNVRYPYRAVVDVPMRPLTATESEPPAVVPPAAGSPATGAQPLRLDGRVVDRQGQPLADIELRLRATDGREDPYFLRTDLDGAFTLPELGPGPFRIEIVGVGFLTIRGAFDLRQPTELQVFMVRQPADFAPSPLELMPPEQPIPPASIGATGAESSTPGR